MPSTGQIRRARARFARLLPDVATIERAVDVADGGGGQTETWAPLATGVPCRLGPLGGGELARTTAARGDQVTDQATATITFEASTDVTEADRVIIAGATYAVTLVKPRGAWELTMRCEARGV